MQRLRVVFQCWTETQNTVNISIISLESFVSGIPKPTEALCFVKSWGSPTRNFRRDLTVSPKPVVSATIRFWAEGA